MPLNTSYTHRQSPRAKRLRLAVYHDGRVVLISPVGIRQSLIDKFFSDKKQWVLDKLEIFKRVGYKPTRKFTRKDYRENKDKALALAHERVRFFNKTYGLPFKNFL